MKPFLQKELQILNDKTHRITNPTEEGAPGRATPGKVRRELGQQGRSWVRTGARSLSGQEERGET